LAGQLTAWLAQAARLFRQRLQEKLAQAGKRIPSVTVPGRSHIG